jgi:hypothetical protein
MDALNPVDCGQLGSGNAVDNSGPKFSSRFSCFLPAKLPFNSLAGSRRFNRSSPSLELRLLGACGKDRAGFPQVGGAHPSEIP